MRRKGPQPVAWVALAAFVVAYGAGPCRLHAHADCHEESTATFAVDVAGAAGWSVAGPCDESDAPACPCPGTCPACSVAKVPGPASAGGLTFAADAAGDAVAEPPLSLRPAQARELMRPPR